MARPRSIAERRQIEHELREVHKAAHHLEAVMEMASMDPRPARRIREEAAAALIELGRPMADFDLTQ